MRLSIGNLYNEIVLNVSGWNRRVTSINIYNECGVLLEMDCGFFKNKNNETLRHVDLDTEKEVKLKRKLRFDGNVFVMTKDGYSEKMWELFIPNELIEFEFVERKLLRSLSTFMVVDKYKSDKIGAVYLDHKPEIDIDKKLYELQQELQSLKQNVSFHKDKTSKELLANIDRMREIVFEYDEEVERIKNLDLHKL